MENSAVTQYYHDDGSNDDELPSLSELLLKQKGVLAATKLSLESMPKKTVDHTLDGNPARFCKLRTSSSQGQHTRAS